MKKIKIKEDALRSLVRNILLETEEQAGAGGASVASGLANVIDSSPAEQVGQDVARASRAEAMSQAMEVLKAFEEIDMEGKILNTMDKKEVLSFYFRHTAVSSCPGGLIKDYGSKLFDFIRNFGDADGTNDPNGSGVDNHIKRMERILKLVGGNLVREKISRADLSSGSGSIVTLLYNAMEATSLGFGYGTDDEGIETALQKSSFKYAIEGLAVNEEYKQATQNKEWAAGNRIDSDENLEDPDLFQVFVSEYGDDDDLAKITEPGNVRQYILTHLVAKPWCKIKVGENEEEDIKLDNMFKILNNYAFSIVSEETEEEEDPSEEDLVVDIESDDPESEEDPEASDSEEIDGVEPPGERRRRDSSRRERRERSDNTDRIKGEIIRLIEPKRLQTGMPKFEDLFDVRAFQRSIVAGMREDRRGFGNGQDFNIEISFNNDGRISRNFSPVGFGQFRIGGKMLRKAKKSRNWKGSLKKIFADALDDALAAKDTEVQDLLGIKRLRMRIIIPAGFYELNESRKKVFLKGKDLLKIIKRL